MTHTCSKELFHSHPFLNRKFREREKEREREKAESTERWTFGMRVIKGREGMAVQVVNSRRRNLRNETEGELLPEGERERGRVRSLKMAVISECQLNLCVQDSKPRKEERTPRK